MVFRNGTQWGDDVPNLGPDNDDTARGQAAAPDSFRLVGVTCAHRGCFEDDGVHSQDCPRNN